MLMDRRSCMKLRPLNLATPPVILGEPGRSIRQRLLYVISLFTHILECDGLGLEIGARVSPAKMVVTSSVSTKVSSSPSVKPFESSECAGEEAEVLEAMGPSN